MGLGEKKTRNNKGRKEGFTAEPLYQFLVHFPSTTFSAENKRRRKEEKYEENTRRQLKRISIKDKKNMITFTQKQQKAV